MVTALRLVRWPNLLIVALTQGLLYFGLFLPAFEAHRIEAALAPWAFLLFVFVTIIVSAAGYIINDIVDVEIDKENRPEKVIVGQLLNIKRARQLYWGLHLIGLLLSVYLADHVGQLALVGLYPAAALFLHLYSTHFQRWALVGNVLVSLFCAGVAGIVWFAEREGFGDLQQVDPERAGQIGGIVTWYLVFAFLSTLYREVVKDIEDQGGDGKARYFTAPVLWGERSAKGLATAFGFGLGLFMTLMLFQERGFIERPWVYYLGASLLLPLGFSLFALWKAEEKADYHSVSQMVKLVMLGGLVLLVLLVV
jgi:4-hydroxybenzoate polyprenyltransferase